MNYDWEDIAAGLAGLVLRGFLTGLGAAIPAGIMWMIVK